MINYLILILSLFTWASRYDRPSDESIKIMGNALVKNNPKLCYSIPDKEKRFISDCISLVAYKYVDKNHCNLLKSNSKQFARCYAHVRAGLCKDFAYNSDEIKACFKSVNPKDSVRSYEMSL